MKDKDEIKKYLDEIDVRLDWIKEQFEVSEDIREFLLDLSYGEFDSLDDVVVRAKDLWRQLQ